MRDLHTNLSAAPPVISTRSYIGILIGVRRFAVICLILVSISSIAWGEAAAARPQIIQAIDEAQLTVLHGNTHPLARPAFDLGPVPPDFPLQRLLLVLKRSPEAEASLQSLLENQQVKSSSSYHKWLTPDQVGQQFGPAPQDVQAVESWLQSHGMQITRVSKGLTTIEFSGTASQVQEAFHTEIHRYVVNGSEHWANSKDPEIPTALVPTVAGVSTLHNFPKIPAHHTVGVVSRSRATGKLEAVNSQFTYSINGNNLYGLGPYDFAAIYNVLPLWNENLDGSGQTIAIVGQSNINLQDVRSFRNLFGLPPNDPQIILDGNDPGLVPVDETESLLDVEWSGSVAKGATIKLVASTSAELSALYIVDNNLAPVMSSSYGLCERFLGSGNQFTSNLWEQAAAQGITVIVASGDAGSADCDQGGGYGYATEFGLMVNGVASTPYNVAVGGTDFNDFNNQNAYWNLNNNTNQASVKGYIPESAWNDSCANPELLFITGSVDPYQNCNDIRILTDPNYIYLNPIAGGGGQSNYLNGFGSGYPKPNWQVGAGVPQDGVRDVPDVALFASNGFNGSFYLVCEADLDPNQVPCDLNSPYADFLAIGGTSASAPAFASMMSIVNQFTESTGQGNANYALYNLAATQPGVFNDVTSGTIALPCLIQTQDCVENPSTAGYGVLTSGNPAVPAFGAGTGYDLATGLGSVNAYNLVHKWSSANFTPTTTSLILNNGNPVSITHGQAVPVSVIVAPMPPAQGIPSGDISLLAKGQTDGAGIGSFKLTAGSVSSATNSTLFLPGGNNTAVTAHYGGDGVFAASDSQPVSVTVLPETSVTTLSVDAIFPGGLFPFGSGPYGYFVYVFAVATNSSLNINVGDSPSGTITFTDTFNGVPSNVPGSPFRLDNTGTATVSKGVVTFAPGNHSITANYSGDANFNPSGPTPASTFTISKAVTSSIIQTNSDAIAPTSTFLLTTTINTNAGFNLITGLFGGAATPSGTVTYYYGTTQLGSPVPVVGSVDAATQTAQAQASATFVGSQLSIGTHNLSAVYSGDANYLGSTATAIPVSVGYPTTTSVSSSTPNALLGTNVAFTATVTSTSPGGSSLTGSVQFLVDGGSMGSPTPLGHAQFSISSLPVGSHSIGAIYSGDSNYLSSTGVFTETIAAPPDFTFSTTPANPATLTIGAPGQTSSPVTFTLTALNGFKGTVNFSTNSCTISPAGSLSSCSFAPASITGNGSTQVMIHTTAPQFASAVFLFIPVNRINAQQMVAGAIVLCLLFSAVPGKRSPRRSLALFVVILTMLFLSHGCGGAGGSSPSGGSGGGGGNGGGGGTVPGTPTGVVYTVTVNAASGQLSHNAAFYFTVQ